MLLLRAPGAFVIAELDAFSGDISAQWRPQKNGAACNKQINVCVLIGVARM